MNHSEDAEKIVAINALAANYGKDLPPQLLDMWLDLLETYSAEQARIAVRKVIETYEYKTMPPFAILKRALDDGAGTSERALEIKAVSEWSALQDEIGSIGSYGTPRLHPVTARVVKLMGGWPTVCRWGLHDLDFKRRDFCLLWVAVYRDQALRRLVDDARGASGEPCCLAGRDQPGHRAEAMADEPINQSAMLDK